MGFSKHGSSNKKWDSEISRHLVKVTDNYRKYRPLGEIKAVPIHWVAVFSKTKGRTRFPKPCVNVDFTSFDVDKGEYAYKDNGCAACKEELKVSYDIYVNVIDRAAQKNSPHDCVKLMKMSDAQCGMVADLSFVVHDEPSEYKGDSPPDATDPKLGFDLMVKKEVKNSKTSYSYNATKVSKLEKEESSLELFDVGALINVGTSKEMSDTISRCMAAIEEERDDEDAKYGRKRTRKKDDYFDEDDDDFDEMPKSKSKKNSKSKKKSSILDESEEESAEDESEEQIQPYARADEDDAPADTDEGDSVEDDSSIIDDSSEEAPPPPKKKKKKVVSEEAPKKKKKSKK